MITAFITLRFLDILDILLVALLLYQIYNLIKGTTAINIFIGIFSLYLLWLIVKALNMSLLSSILGQVIGVGVIALLIVFQQEVRRFLLVISTRYIRTRKFSIDNFFSFGEKKQSEVNIDAIVSACSNMSTLKTGALIALTRNSDLLSFIKTGDIINADTTSRLLESIFFKNSPLHDGAVIIKDDRIVAARCVLPATERIDLPAQFGMRHRAALGIAEKTDAIVILVSEETGAISFAREENIETNIGPKRLRMILEQEFIQNIK